LKLYVTGSVYERCDKNDSITERSTVVIDRAYVLKYSQRSSFNPLNIELNPICHFLALLEGANIADVSGLRVKFNERFRRTYW
jgi:hypothetical protein